MYLSSTQSASHVLTKEEREISLGEMKRKKEYEQNASEERKNFMQTMEMKRKENAKPSDLEEVFIVNNNNNNNDNNTLKEFKVVFFQRQPFQTQCGLKCLLSFII